MAWRHEKAEQRIQKLIDDAPQVQVSRFVDDYMPLYEMRRAELSAKAEAVSPPLFNLEKGKAVLVDTVQIYVGITNYDEYRIEEDGRETEASHERALRFLHLYYSACDRVVESGSVQRVDFHGGRMHAVILPQDERGVTQTQIDEAFGFVRDFQAVAEQANRELANSQFDAQFRVGIDAGRCVAINNGTGLEQEPMFLGSAANHAAKLAEGDESGVFVSDRVRQILGRPTVGSLEAISSLERDYLTEATNRRDANRSSGLLEFDSSRAQKQLVETWKKEIRNDRAPNPTVPRFAFHYKEPPLSTIKYADLSPSDTIRMPLASLFADLTGFTKYVDNAITNGSIAGAVRALYVIRQELQNVVEADFGGRKVRFIGDCIHAVIAEGSKTTTDDGGTVKRSFECAGGLRSSFEICRQELSNLGTLGLAIGVEYGSTPISRIGIRGERSVRVASSRATATSERMQSECGSNSVKFGPFALALMPVALSDLVNLEGVANSIHYDDVVTSVSAQEAAQQAPVYARAHAPDQVSGSRAHFQKS